MNITYNLIVLDLYMIFEFYSKLKQKKRKAQPVPLDNKRIHQTLFYCDALNKIKGIDGDIVECGTGFGRSAFIIGELCNALKIKKKFIYVIPSLVFQNLVKKIRK